MRIRQHDSHVSDLLIAELQANVSLQDRERVPRKRSVAAAAVVLSRAIAKTSSPALLLRELRSIWGAMLMSM